MSDLSDITDLTIPDPDEITTDALDELTRAHTDALNDRLIDAAADGYDYLYVVNDYATRNLRSGVFQTDRLGEELTASQRTLATNAEPEALLPMLKIHGSARAYDLSILTEAEREQIADGDIPRQLLITSVTEGDDA
ncbi:hypothetical protein SAMN05216388_101743 [Halorientalis persicus]|uniref:Uncharacterized protein n=1 Tax=Halorientalis persicus TaxID=1367881 RepID=A0A1H8RVE6_9EURY|nr:hypothetical protein [Halorientalis persicus]SEO70154.1 hypothetical protein SAMN05216388_101743 [Halorientalis persicus]